jgi:hypothetical protein
MMAHRRYQIAFLALGWLILLAVLFNGRLGSGLEAGYARVEQSLARFGQRLSDAEGAARHRARGTSRAEELAERAPGFATLESLRNPQQVLFGVYDGAFPKSFSGFEDLETRTGHRFPIISMYQAWGDRPDQAHFPIRGVGTIDRLGSVPMITWEPWVVDFDPILRSNLPPLKEREYASLAAIARGDYDFYVTSWAKEAARYGKPLFLRFAHEMNDPYRYPWGPQNGNRADEFVAAWQRVHGIFQKMEATNVLWVWSPHISMPWLEAYYPGDEWVDWIGTAVLNYGDAATWSRWWTFDQIFGKSYPSLLAFGKPIMIAEFGTLTSGGNAPGWYAAAFRDIETKYPSIKAIVFFNQKQDTTLSTFSLDWSVTQSTAITDAVRAALERPL